MFRLLGALLQPEKKDGMAKVAPDGRGINRLESNDVASHSLSRAQQGRIPVYRRTLNGGTIDDGAVSGSSGNGVETDRRTDACLLYTSDAADE